MLTNQSIAIVLFKDIDLDQITESKRQLLMTDLKTLDQLYTHIMKTIVSTGVAPHYTEIATSLGVEVEQARTSLNDLMGPGKMAGYWLVPGTDVIGSFAPFNNVPTHYRITVDG
ncbi:uncharacterized protein METZ01_LOCUS90931, partial [marine metagenome]